MNDDKLTDDLNKDFASTDGTDSENNNDDDYSLDFNLDEPVVGSSPHKENEAVERNKREDQTPGGALDQDFPWYVDFAISDKQKSLGIICVAREGNTIVIKIRKDVNTIVIKKKTERLVVN